MTYGWTALNSAYHLPLQAEMGGALVDRKHDVILHMDQHATVPSVSSYSSVLKACAERKSLAQAKQVYASLARHGSELTKGLGELVVSTLVKCGGLEDALHVFYKLPHRSVFSWTAIISGYTTAEQDEEALRMYQWMQQEGVQPNTYTFVSLLQACGSLGNLEEGKRIHAEALKHRCESDLFVRNCLVDMYGKCGSIVDAQTVFDGVTEKSVVSWNVMLSVYVEQGKAEKALQLYEQMREEGVIPTNRTFVRALQACGLLSENDRNTVMNGQFTTTYRSLYCGKAVHADALTNGYHSDLFVGNTLISMYGKCGSITDSRNVFDGLLQRDLVSWTVMIAAYVAQGQPEEALQLYGQMREEGMKPKHMTYVSVLQACGMLGVKQEHGEFIKVDALEKGRAIHADICRQGCSSDVFVGAALVSMYGKCGSAADAQVAFDGLFERNVVAWTALLMAHVEQGQADKALQLYEVMQEEGVSPNERTFVSTLQACSMIAGKEVDGMGAGQSCTINYLERGKAIHADAQRKGYDSEVLVGAALIRMYGKYRRITDAEKVFGGVSHLGVVVWSAMLVVYIEQGQAEAALNLFGRMRQKLVSPDDRTFVSVLQACGMVAEREEGTLVDGRPCKVKSLEVGKGLHEDVCRNGYETNVFVSNSLISMYGKCGSIMNAQAVFDGLSQPDMVSWNSMLTASVEQSQPERALRLYYQMRDDCVSPDDRTFVAVLQACMNLAEKEDVAVGEGLQRAKTLYKGKAIHGNICWKGYQSHAFVANTLINLYSKCGTIVDALNVFYGLSHHDVVSLNAMLTAYIEHDEPEKVLQLYEEMLVEGVSPNNRTFVSGIQACGMLAEKEADIVGDWRSSKNKYYEKGRALHVHAFRRGHGADVFVGNTLVSMYGKCGSILDAQIVFEGLPQRDVVSWSAMLAAYVEQGCGETAWHLYQQMQEEGVSPNDRIFVSTLQACGMLAEKEADMTVDGRSTKVKRLEEGKAVHAVICSKTYSSDVFVCSSLISMYGKCRSIVDARHVFDASSVQHVSSWNAMLASYVENGKDEEALHLYKEMQLKGVSPDDITLVCALQGFANTGGFGMVERIHQTLVSTGHNLSPFLASSLISAYGRCASMKNAQRVFDGLPQPDLVSWNALVSSYSRQGDCKATLQCFENMQLSLVKPNGVTFLSLLSACSHGGLVDKGVLYFESMSKDYGISPEIEHYVSMVDLLGRAGCFSRIQDLLCSMPMQPDLAVWLCLLSACQKHGKVVLGKQAFDSAVSLQPKNAAPYMLMWNLYVDAGLLDSANEVSRVRLKEGAWKSPGESWIEHEQGLSGFLVGDCKHPQQTQINDLLRETSLRLTSRTAPLPKLCSNLSGAWN